MIAVTAQQFAESGKAWVEAVSLVLNTGIAQFGILAIAAIGVWKTIQNKAELREQIKATKEEFSGRLTEQARRINDVAMAVPATNGGPLPVRVEQPESEPIPVKES